ncbi:hypothetical protein YSY43_22090 [Paenibacillus sp. YSY-4.3]
MSQERVKEIEKYLMSKKKKSPTPHDVSFARTHLMLIKDEIGDEELINIKILYQSKLAGSPFTSNHLAIIAMLVSIIIFMLSTLSLTSIVDKIFFAVVTFIMLTLMTYMQFSNVKNANKNFVYTIIINLIDETLLKK